MTRRKPFDLQQMKCSVKRAFESERIARRAADAREAEIMEPLFVYRCPHCKDWHMTRTKPWST